MILSQKLQHKFDCFILVGLSHFHKSNGITTNVLEISISNNFLGMDVTSLEGKMTQQKLYLVATNFVDIPPEIYDKNQKFITNGMEQIVSVYHHQFCFFNSNGG